MSQVNIEFARLVEVRIGCAKYLSEVGQDSLGLRDGVGISNDFSLSIQRKDLRRMDERHVINDDRFRNSALRVRFEATDGFAWGVCCGCARTSAQQRHQGESSLGEANSSRPVFSTGFHWLDVPQIVRSSKGSNVFSDHRRLAVD